MDGSSHHQHSSPIVLEKASTFRQFRTLTKKNWVLRRRACGTLICEMMLPILFFLAMSAIPRDNTVIPEQVPSVNFAVPDLGYILRQTTSNATQPNILCYDDNLFLRCSCDYDKTDYTFLTDESIDQYYEAGMSYTVESLFSVAHSNKAFQAVCAGVVLASRGSLAAGDDVQGCETAQLAFDFCPRLASLFFDFQTGVDVLDSITLQEVTSTCGALPTAQLETLAEEEAVIADAIRVADGANAGASIPDPEPICQWLRFGVAPLRPGLSGTAGLPADEAAAYNFYAYLVETFDGIERHLQNFTSANDIDAWVLQSGYSQSNDIEMLQGAIAFSGDWEYSLRVNYTQDYVNGQESNQAYFSLAVPSTEKNIDPTLRDANQTSMYNQYTIYPYFQSYYTSGVLTMQQAVDSFILDQQQAGIDLQVRKKYAPPPPLS
jgi:hypothetical protein